MTLFSDSKQERSGGLVQRGLLEIATFGAAAVLFAGGCTKFQDTPGPGEENFGRTVNGFSTMLSGILAQNLETNASLNLVIVKPGWNDAKITGSTTSTSITSTADLTLTSCNFKAAGEAGKLKGEVDKSEFNWTIVQNGPQNWSIERFGLKRNYTLTYTLTNGAIKGTLSRPMSWDWDFSGTYREHHLDLKVSTGFGDPNFSINGSITNR